MPLASAFLGAASAAILALSVVWAWRTFDFWETVPMVPCLLAAGVLACLAIYTGSRRPLLALFVGVLTIAGGFVATLLVTLARWEG